MNEVTPLFKKLNFKNQKQLLVLNVPLEFMPHLLEMEDTLNTSFEVNEIKGLCDFVVLFVQKEEDLQKAKIVLSTQLSEDALLWIAYPKGSSQKYKSIINRDNGWQMMGDLGFEPVRQVAIDTNWSALRFRKVQFIKNMERNSSMILSKEGKERIQKN